MILICMLKYYDPYSEMSSFFLTFLIFSILLGYTMSTFYSHKASFDYYSSVRITMFLV